MALKLYNTLTRQKADFVPIDPKNVRMYVCGPTVYDFAHIGNARPVIVFDVLFRLLRHIYGPEHVTYARNITDVDDKINARALRDFPDLPLNDAIARVTEKTTAQFHADVKALGCLEPTVEPRATDNIAQMIAIIEQLLARGHAYAAAGEVLFDVASMPDYGALSNRKLEDQQAGARVEVEAHKKNPGDFVLWKLSSAEEPGWESPWGRGRPGWHIECSAMSERYLGETFDIHGGGLDLIFPHHENEIAQSRCAHGTRVMANVWMHNGFLQVEGEKMSKSLGNFVTINELLKHWHGPEVRLLMLQTHYRQPINWTKAGLIEARKSWRDLVLAASDVRPATDLPENFVQCLLDDLNSPAAITCLHELKDKARSGSLVDRRSLLKCLEFMGVVRPWEWEDELPDYIRVTASPRDFYDEYLSEANGDSLVRQSIIRLEEMLGKVGKALDEPILSAARQLSADVTVRDLRDINPIDVFEQAQARLAARKRKDFAESDRIRDELAKMGIALKDSKNKDTGEIETTWEVIR